MLEVENLAGKETGSVPEHAFKYPYSDPVSKGSTKKAQPFTWLLGRKRVLEDIHLISWCHFPLKRSSLSCAIESLLWAVFLACCAPLWAALLEPGWGGLYAGVSCHQQLPPPPCTPECFLLLPASRPPRSALGASVCRSHPQEWISFAWLGTSHRHRRRKYVPGFFLCQPWFSPTILCVITR